MTAFGFILSQIKERLDIEQGKSREIATLMSEISGVVINEADIAIKKETIIVALSPTAKMALYIKRDAILRACNERGIQVRAIV